VQILQIVDARQIERSATPRLQVVLLHVNDRAAFLPEIRSRVLAEPHVEVMASNFLNL
jgi:hypothetical protein